ncbi:unnamed protein product [Anisakis simplex]|uniref:SET domain-containing protein n=1 Tax=Anisakis simplex TaxID=6269 RepID=A0A0M3KC07_ANISI|nr:unnamed protein product [Anisakis simplex]
MNEEQQKRVTQMKLELPSLYRFDDVNRSSDARILERNETNIEVLREWFECMPCVAVRSGNKLVSVGVSTPLTIYPFSSPPDEVFTALEMRVCQECISKTFWPFELIDADNKDWLKCYNDSSLWTHLDGADGKPIIVNMIC